jgi:hypothetical protein
MILHWRARYWPWSGEIVIGGRPAEREVERADWREGEGVRRCVSAWVVREETRASLPVEVEVERVDILSLCLDCLYEAVMRRWEWRRSSVGLLMVVLMMLREMQLSMEQSFREECGVQIRM